MLWIVLGDYGSGKTLFLVLQGFSAKGDVWGNFDLKLIKDNYTRIEPMDLRHLGFNKIVVLDEMQTWLESRISMSFLNRFITNIIDQTDKRDVDVFGTAHILSSIDRRFRDNVHRIVKCERIGREREGRTRLNDFRDFRFRIMNTFDGKVKKKTLRYSKAEKYFKRYHTSEIIQYPNQKDLELEILLKSSPMEAYEIISGIAQDLKDNGGTTHASIGLSLLKSGYSVKHERLVYSRLKELEKE